MDPMWPVGGCAAHSPQRERLYTARSAPVMIITRSARGSVCRVRLSVLARVSVCVCLTEESQSLSETLFHIPLRVFFSLLFRSLSVSNFRAHRRTHQNAHEEHGPRRGGCPTEAPSVCLRLRQVQCTWGPSVCGVCEGSPSALGCRTYGLR